MRDWIAINGRKLIWEDFIGILDYYRCKSVIRGRGHDACSRYNYMIYVLQELAHDYHEGSDYVLDNLADFVTRHYMKMPKERRLPEALEELFNQMQGRLHLDLSEMLDECAKNSLKTYQRMQDTERAENERAALISTLPVRHGDLSSRDPVKKVAYLMSLQRAKAACPDYAFRQQETQAAVMWCELLILGLSADMVTIGILRRAVEDGILSEAEIEGILKGKCHIEKDYEWYCEDFMGCSLNGSTDIPIRDFLRLCEGRFREILGIREGQKSI